MNTKHDHSAEFTPTPEVVINEEATYLQISPKFGLALSGGGIRSASFALGVLQSLAKSGLLSHVDYLSTVSGGGYIGSALVWWKKQGLPVRDSSHNNTYSTSDSGNHDFPFGAVEEGPSSTTQDSILDFLRFHSSYLVPGRGMDILSVVGILLRNILMSLLMHVGVVGLFLFLFFSALIVLNYLNPTWFELATTLIPFVAESASSIFGVISPPTSATTVDAYIYRICFYIAIYTSLLFLIATILYSIGTFGFQITQLLVPESHTRSLRYSIRNWSQVIFGYLIKMLLMFSLLTSLPVLAELMSDHTYLYPMTIGGSLLLVFAPFRTDLFNQHGILDHARRLFGAVIFLYFVTIISYNFVSIMLFVPIDTLEDLRALSAIGGGGAHRYNITASMVGGFYTAIVIIWIGFVFLVGTLVNVNYFGIHRMYRDRLMELFLPDNESVLDQEWGKATVANTVSIQDVCGDQSRRPYLLINTNIVLTDSRTKKFRERGGDNFILSRLYCGSGATGWRRSHQYMKRTDAGMTLATAMAISGAAASPYAGADGTAWTRNRWISIMMSMLSLRLGYWAPHPHPGKNWIGIPNFIFPGMMSVLIGGNLHEDYKIIDLTDGGHFENLGLYELVRRRLKLIVICDSSADPDGKLQSLALAIERVRVF